MGILEEGASSVNTPELLDFSTQVAVQAGKFLQSNPELSMGDAMRDALEFLTNDPAPHKWSDQDLEHLYDFESQKGLMLEMQITRLQVQQNQLAMTVMALSHDFFIEIEKSGQHESPLMVLEAHALVQQWNQIEMWVRVLRHQQRLLAPLTVAHALGEDKLPVGDWALEHFWQMAQNDWEVKA